jgi:hypothetical protein
LDRGERRRPEEVIWTRETTNATGSGKSPGGRKSLLSA